MDILFWILILIIIICSIIGYVRGLIKSLIRIVLTISTFIIAYFVAPFVGQVIIDTTDFDNRLESVIVEKIQYEVENKAKETYKKEIQEEYGKYSDLLDEDKINELIASHELSKTEEMDIINQINAPDFVKKILKENNSKEFMNKIGANNFYEYIAKYISYMIIKMLAFIIVIIVFSLIALCIYIACSGLSKLPVLRSVDKIAGLIFGAVEGVFICWIIIIAFNCVSSMSVAKGSALDKNKENKSLEKFYEQDIIDDVINKIIRLE